MDEQEYLILNYISEQHGTIGIQKFEDDIRDKVPAHEAQIIWDKFRTRGLIKIITKDIFEVTHVGQTELEREINHRNKELTKDELEVKSLESGISANKWSKGSIIINSIIGNATKKLN